MEKYTKGDIVGEGTFGIVYRAIEKSTQRKVAIKKIRMGNFKDGVSFTGLREIKVLQEIKHENIINLIEAFSHNSNIHLVFEFLDWTLEDVIKDKSIILHESDIKSYMLQILKGVEELHKNWILHRDLKPNNLLMSPNGVVKLADFGFARAFGSPNNNFTQQVVTRWYRAPELLYGARVYGDAIDMWAVGCIFAELMLRTPYLPGDNDIEQLSLIFTALGTPDEQVWPGVTLLPDYVQFNYCAPTPFKQLFSAASDDALDLLAAMLRFDPYQRISAAAALKHPYFTNSPSPTPPSQLPRPALAKKLDQDEVMESPATKRPGADANEERPSTRRKLEMKELEGIKRKLDMG